MTVALYKISYLIIIIIIKMGGGSFPKGWVSGKGGFGRTL